jgi:hypothetical protein
VRREPGGLSVPYTLKMPPLFCPRAPPPAPAVISTPITAASKWDCAVFPSPDPMRRSAESFFLRRGHSCCLSGFAARWTWLGEEPADAERLKALLPLPPADEVAGQQRQERRSDADRADRLGGRNRERFAGVSRLDTRCEVQGTSDPSAPAVGCRLVRSMRRPDSEFSLPVCLARLAELPSSPPNRSDSSTTFNTAATKL